MRAIWLETVPKDSEELTLGMRSQVDLVHHRNVLVVVMLLTGNMRFVQPHSGVQPEPY